MKKKEPKCVASLCVLKKAGIFLHRKRRRISTQLQNNFLKKERESKENFINLKTSLLLYRERKQKSTLYKKHDDTKKKKINFMWNRS